MRKKHGLVLDFDGTMTEKSYGSLYKVVDENALPPEAKPEYEALRNKYLPRVYDGTLAPIDELYWLRETLDIYVRHRLNLIHWANALTQVKLRPGSLEFLEFAESRGVPVAIVSYGVADFIEVLLFIHAYSANDLSMVAAARLTHDDAGFVVGYEDDSFVYPDNKDIWSKKFADKHGISIGNLLAIGDSGADRKLGGLKENRLGIAKDVKNAAHLSEFFGEVVITESLEPAREWLERKLNSAD